MPKKKKSQNYEVVSEILEDKRARESIIALPCEIFEFEGEIGFRFFAGGRPGIVALEFDSRRLAEWALSEAKAVMRATLAAKITGQTGAEEFLSSEKAQEYPTDAAARETAQVAAMVFIKSIPGKLGSLLGELELEVACYMRGITSIATGAAMDSGVERLAKEMAAERKRFLKASIARFGAPKWGNMKAHYDELLPLTKAAKEVYESNKTRDWQAMVKAGFPQFDEDLIILLSNDPKDLERLSERAKKATENSEDYSLPANIALEQSARRCGMKDFDLVPRSIRDLMNKSESLKSSDKNISVKPVNSLKSPSKTISPKRPKSVKRSRPKTSREKLVSLKVH